MTTLTQASHEWATRPADQRFLSLDDMLAYSRDCRERSTGRVISNRAVRAIPVEGDNKALALQDRDSRVMLPTHWAFGQLAARAGAPADYMRKLPSPIAADCINFGLRTRDVEEFGLLHRDDFGSEIHTLAAATGPNYGRIWNVEVIDQLVARFGDGRSGDWRIPGEFGQKVPITKANTTLYASDRDMFVFLADEDHRIEVPARRNGQAGSLARGIFVWNSEVGSATLGIAAFTFDYVCSNRMVWGVDQFSEVRIRHTSGAPDRFIEEVSPALKAYANASTVGLNDAIKAARARRIEDVEDFLSSRFSSGQVKGITLAHEADEGRPMESLWDVTNGITAYAREMPNQDTRVKLEQAAGKLMKLAA